MKPRKPVFDAVREMLGRGFRKNEVDTLDDALDKAAGKTRLDRVTRGPCIAPTGIGAQGIALIKRFEGCARARVDGKMEAYPDPGTGGEPWTIGWGATGIGLDSQRIGAGTVWTQDQCDARLEEDLVRYSDDVTRAIGDAPTTQSQFDAMVSFHYNTGAIGRATLTKRHKAGDYSGAAREFDRWNKAGGGVMRGLSRRRAAEKDLYLG